MKLGIIVDSSSGLTKEEAIKKGWGFLPLYMTIDGKEYADGIDMDSEKYYEMIKVDMDVRTSATPPGIIEEELKRMSEKFDHVIVYALSKELSSQTNNIKVVAREFKNVYVLDSIGVGHGIVYNCKKFEKLAKTDITPTELNKKAEKIIKKFDGFVIPETMHWLVKGGRTTASAAAMANMLKIVPIISFKHGKLEKGGKGRVFKKTVIKTSISYIKHHKEASGFILLSAGNKNIETYFKSILEEVDAKIEIKKFPPIIGNHVGKGAIALLSYNDD